MGTLDRLRFAARDSPTLGELPETLARVHGERTLIVEPSTQSEYSAQQIDEITNTYAAFIRTHTKFGETVVVALPNGVEFFLTCLSVARAGRVVVPVSVSVTPDELAHVVSDSGASLVLTEALKRERVHLASDDPTNDEESLQTDPQSVAAILYTSGTTGQPKGAELTHTGLLAGVQRLAAIPLHWRDDEVISALPISHIMGFSALLSLMTAGVRTVVFDKFQPIDVLDALESRKSSVFIGVPAMYQMMEDAGASSRNLRSVRIWISGADAMPPALIAAFQRYGASVTLPITGTSLGQATFVEGYGMVELSGGVATKITPPYAGRWLTKPVALPLPGNQLRVVDPSGNDVASGEVGELLVAGPGVFRGYRAPGRPQSNLEGAHSTEGWVHTGDLAKKRPFGAVELAGRAKNVIKVGGYSVFAAEVERVLTEHELVDEAVVIALANRRTGEAVGAVLRSSRMLSAAEITSVEHFARERLSKYKVPTEWRVVEEFDRTETGKVRRNTLRQLFEGSDLPVPTDSADCVLEAPRGTTR
jgi:acyl-CoA synthetase (AMP-forming)/AMP-acid ligase II